MSRMAWFRGKWVDIQGFQVRGDPQIMAKFLRETMIAHLRDSCRHERAAARILWALSDRAADPRLSVLFEQMAFNEKRRISRQTRELGSLEAAAWPDRDRWRERVWRWLLVELGPAYAMRWILYIKRQDLRHLMHIRRLISVSRSAWPIKTQNDDAGNS